MSKCTNCEKLLKNKHGWHLRNYFGLSGLFCQTCYSKVSHDSGGNPKQPLEYIAILLKRLGDREQSYS